MPMSSEHFALLRLSNPAAAFAALYKDFFRAIEDDCAMAAAFASFEKCSTEPLNSSKDASRIHDLIAQGADKLGIKVGSLPLGMSASLAFAYDAAVEALRSSDVRIETRMFGARAVRTAGLLLNDFLHHVGSLNVTALELALRDERYAERLRQRAGELGKVTRLDGVVLLPPDPTLCEHCVITEKDKDGNIIGVYCPTKEECNRLGGLLIFLLLVWLIVKLIDWLF